VGTVHESYVYKAFQFYARHGLSRTLERSAVVIHRRVLVRFRDWQFDRRFGIHTGGDVTYSPNSGVPLHRSAQNYQATSLEIFNKIMRSVGCLTAP
jgi:SAM-dependent methyltransferase